MGTVIALLQVAAQCTRATLFNGTHDPKLLRRQVWAMGLTIVIAVAVENIRDLQGRPGHRQGLKNTRALRPLVSEVVDNRADQKGSLLRRLV